MSSESRRPGNQGASAAINRIIDQERKAREELEACRREASKIRDRARETARRIEAVADRRAQRVHEAGDRMIAAGLRELEARMRTRDRKTATELPDPEAWDGALAVVARYLVGLDEDPGR